VCSVLSATLFHLLYIPFRDLRDALHVYVWRVCYCANNFLLVVCPFLPGGGGVEGYTFSVLWLVPTVNFFDIFLVRAVIVLHLCLQIIVISCGMRRRKLCL
jgi:hypothetical protein